MAKAPVRPAPKSAPAKGGDSFDQLAEMLRTLLGSKIGPLAPPDDDEEDDEDEMPEEMYRPGKGVGPGPFGDMMPKKGMRRISISILMPMHKPGQK